MGVALLEAALREAASRPALQSMIHCRLAWVRRYKEGLEHARAALELAEELDDDVLRAHARAVQAILGWFVGIAEASDDLPAHARDFASAVGGDQLVREATLAVVNTFAPSSKRAEARALLEREHEEWRERDEPRSARALWGLAWVEFWAGRWALAAAHAARAHDISVQYGLEVPQDHLPIAVIAVHRGQLELAREHSERALKLAGASVPAAAAHGGPRDLSRSGAEIRPQRRSGSARPTGGPRRSAGASRASAGGAPTTPSFSSSSAGSTMRCASSTSGRQMRRGSAATGCSRT